MGMSGLSRSVLCCADLLPLQHEELVGPRAKEAQRLEEERACVFGRLDELKGRVKELEQQLQETSREVRVWVAPTWALGSRLGWSGHADTAVSPQAEMERALLQGERESEVARLQQEQEVVQQLQEKLSGLDASIRKERDKVSPEAGLSPWGCDMLSPALVPTCRDDAGGVLPCWNMWLDSAEAFGDSCCVSSMRSSQVSSCAMGAPVFVQRGRKRNGRASWAVPFSLLSLCSHCAGLCLSVCLVLAWCPSALPEEGRGRCWGCVVSLTVRIGAAGLP